MADVGRPPLVEAPAVARLRALLPEAKRLLSRQHIGAPWHALLAAEELLAELDAAREAWRREAAWIDDFLRPAPAPEPEFHKRVFRLLPVFFDPGRTEDFLLDLALLEYRSVRDGGDAGVDLAILAHALTEDETPLILRQALESWLADRGSTGASHAPFWVHLKRVMSALPEPEPGSAATESRG